MKKTFFMLFACAAMMASCNNGKTSTTASTEDSVATDSVVYEGTTPAADSDGIFHHLVMARDSTMGFNLTVSYMKSETEVDTSYYYSGKAIATTATVGGKENNYYKLPTAKNDTVYLMVLNDSTLRMVNSELEEAIQTEGMSYDLKLVK